MQKFSMTVLFVLVTLVGFAKADTPTQADTAPSLVVGQVATIQGVVRFEEHHTIIPFWCSPGAPIPCASSRLYWSVVIYSDTNAFEIDQRFALDQNAAPDSVELGGESVRAGQVVKVEATVEYAGSNYYILGSVRNVNLVFDSSTRSLPNWTCHGIVDRDTEIQAQVWYTGSDRSANGEQYALRLAGSQDSQDGHRVFSLASLSDAQAFTSHDELVYQGQSADANVELVISEPASAQGEAADIPAAEVPGRLSFTLSQPPVEQSRIQAQGDFAVLCGRTR